MTAAISRLRALVHRHEPRVWLFWAVGATVLLATTFAFADPAVLVFVLDPELLALVVMVGLALLRSRAAGLLDLLTHVGNRVRVGQPNERR